MLLWPPVLLTSIQALSQWDCPKFLFPVLLAVLYMSLFGSIIGLTAYIKGQDGMEASEASLFTYLQPLVYIPLSVLWLHEQLTLTMLVAMVLIGIGVYSAEKRV